MVLPPYRYRFGRMPVSRLRRWSRRDGFVSNYTPTPFRWIVSQRRQPDVEDGAAPLVAHDAQGLGDGRLDLAGVAQRAAEGTAGSDGDGGVVGRRIEADVDVGGAAGIAVGMDGEGGELRRLPAAVVVDDLQERRLVLARHPMHGRGLREHVAAVAGERDHGGLRAGQLGANGGAAVPAERAAAAGEHRAGRRLPDMISDHVIV